MPFDLATATAGLQAMSETIKVLRTITGVAAELKQAVADATDRLIDAQQLVFTLQQEIYSIAQEKRDLEAQIQSADRWEQQKARYTLTEIARGAFVKKLTAQGSEEPMHYACNDCMNDGKITPLQRREGHSGLGWECTRCKTIVWEF